MKIALVGNQNSGKTTLFNLLTGTNQKVGNWPGVTIERKEGIIKGINETIVDLPGIYSLSPYTSEEEVSRRYVIDEKPDLIINIIDATSIERSLYLTTQLLELDCDVILALNMCDALEKKGISIDEKKLSKLMNTSIVKISALKQTGIDELIYLIKEKKFIKNTHQKIYSSDIEKIIELVKHDEYHQRFISVKALENDPNYSILKNKVIKEYVEIIEDKYGYEIEQVIANQRYDYIVSLKKECVIQELKGETITDKLDKIFINKWAAIPIFIVIMALIYILAVGVVGSATVDFIDGNVGLFQEWLSNTLENLNASDWVISLVCDGIVAGVGAVLNFVPQLIILFLLISILETTGYMSRIAFVLDKVFRKFGLSGKSLIPFIVGAGCTVPGIMSARTVEDEGERRITIMCAPFIPCSAKLPIIVMFSSCFFGGDNMGLVTVSLYFLSIVMILLSAIILKKFFIKTSDSSFISELPEYKLPSPKYVLRDVWEKVWSFFKRAGTVILLCSIVIWFMLNFGLDFWNGMVDDINDSILASLGNALAWLFYPMLGEWSWEATVSAIQGLVAKEQVVSSMNIIAGLSESNESYKDIFTSGAFSFFNNASAYAYSVFCLFSAPCFGAIGAMKKELGSSKRMWQAVLFQTGLAWVLAVIVFSIGSLFLL